MHTDGIEQALNIIKLPASKWTGLGWLLPLWDMTIDWALAGYFQCTGDISTQPSDNHTQWFDKDIKQNNNIYLSIY